MARSLLRDDGGVTEVVGYIMTFALSSIILLISIQSFTVARENSEAVVTGVEMRTIANRVATRIVETSLLAEEFPNATVNVTVNIPADFHGHEYTVEAFSDRVEVVGLDGIASATATTFKLDALPDVSVSGKVYSSAERVLITYHLHGTTKVITIRGG